MGHLNVGFYVAKSMEALAGLAAELGMPGACAASAEATLVVREQHIRFIKEAHPGAPLTITGGVIEMGEADARLLLLMRHQSGDLAASFQTKVAPATARDGRAFPWPDRIRARAEALQVEFPCRRSPLHRSRPRRDPGQPGPRRRAGPGPTGLRVIGAEDCDAFGRMRTEMFMHRLSDGIPHFFAGRRPGAADHSGRWEARRWSTG